jgi:tetratricopeptide (TPR) repeat protein
MNRKRIFFSKLKLVAAVLIMLVHCIPVFAETVSPEIQKQLNDYYEKAWILLGQMHKDASNLNKADAIYQKALQLAPDNSKTYWKLAEISFKMAQASSDEPSAKKLYDQALDHAKKSVSINPDSVGGLYWVGTCEAKQAELAGIFKAMGLVKSAKKNLNKCIALAPNNRFSILARVILSALYAEPPWPMRDLGEADRLTAKAVEMDPNLTLASLNRAKVHIKNGYNDLAKKEIQRCLNIKNPTYVWDATLYDWPEAKKLLNQIK